MIRLFFSSLAVILFSGCSWLFPTPVVETVIDRVYVPRECPTYDYQFEFVLKKYESNIQYADNVIAFDSKELITDIEQYKMAKNKFNEYIINNNNTTVVYGTPLTNNFKRVEKRIFVDRPCPKFNYSPEFKIVKANKLHASDNNVTIFVSDLPSVITNIEKFKMYKTRYNEYSESTVPKNFTDVLQSKLTDTQEIIKSLF